MKAQSAIEYLITYGWMLVAVSIVGGSVYSFVGQPCISSSSGSFGESVSVNEFGLQANSNNISYIIENGNNDAVKIKSVKFESNGKTAVSSLDSRINPLESKSFSINGFAQKESCNTMQVNIIYDLDTGSASLKDQEVNGEITGNIEIGNETSVDLVAAPENVSISFTG